MNRFFITMLLLSVTTLVTNAQNYNITSGATFKPFSFSELMAPVLMAQQAYNNTMSSINDLYDDISEILGRDIDNQLRQELNRELKLLDEVADNLSKTGQIANARNRCNTIRRNVQKEIANYNGRVAQERERQAKQEAEERARAEQERAQPQDWSGTGFALKNGYVVTNYHVIENAKSITIQGVKGDFDKSYRATVVGSDKYDDLALLKINDPSFQGFGTIPYALSSTTAEVGEEIFVLGYPLTSTMGDEIKLTNGIISSKTGFQGDVSLYQMSAPVQPGNSGGPLFDKKGNVIGVVSSKHTGAENVGYAIKSSYMKNLIESCASSAIIPTGNTVATLPFTSKVKAEKNFVFYIKCSSTGNSTFSSISSYGNHGNSSPTPGKTYSLPTVNRNLSNGLKVISVVVQNNQTILLLSSNNKRQDGYYSWMTLDKNAYIVANGQKYTLTKAKGIALSPDKTYFSYAGETKNFTLYFPAIPANTTSIDFVESSDSEWQLYGIQLR